MAQSGTSVTTWKDTRAATQFWEFPSLNAGGKLIVPWNNKEISINIYWGSSNPEVNFYSVSQNGYYDAAMTFESKEIFGMYQTMFISATPSASYGKRYISVTSQNNATSDYNGTSKIVRWQTTPYRFYDFDDRAVQ